MPFSCQINAKANFAHLHGVGVVTDQEFLDVVDRLYADPHFNPKMRTLMDLRDVSDNQITLESLEKTAKVSRIHPKTRRAIIVGTTTDFHLAREHQTLLSMHSKSRPRLFHSAQEALDYLNEGFPLEEQLR